MIITFTDILGLKTDSRSMHRSKAGKTQSTTSSNKKINSKNRASRFKQMKNS